MIASFLLIASLNAAPAVTPKKYVDPAPDSANKKFAAEHAKREAAASKKHKRLPPGTVLDVKP